MLKKFLIIASTVLTLAVTVPVAQAAVDASACSTAGNGVTCFAGKKFCPNGNTCYDPATQAACGANTHWDCNACACVCDNQSGSCSVGPASATCYKDSETNVTKVGVYTGSCSNITCPSGRTFCSTNSTCRTNRVCPAGTVWDVCTDICSTPYILQAPSAAQSVANDITFLANETVNGNETVGGSSIIGNATPTLSAAGQNLIYGNVAAGSSLGSLFKLQKGAVNRFVIDLSGNTALAGNLDVQGGTISNSVGGTVAVSGNFSVSGTTNFTGNNTFSGMTSLGAIGLAPGAGQNGIYEVVAGGSAGNLMLLQTYSGGIYTDRFKVDAAGNVTATKFFGDGSALSNVAATTIAAGTYPNAVTFSNALNTFNGTHTGDGTGLTGVCLTSGTNCPANLSPWNRTAPNVSLVTATDKVGIGTATPARKLDVSNAGQITFGDDVVTDAQKGIFWHVGSGYGIYRNSGGWSAPNYQQMRIAFDSGIQLSAGTGVGTGYGKSYVEVVSGLGLMVTSGNVGVGTTAPVSKLQVTGDITIPYGNKYYYGVNGAVPDTNWSTGYVAAPAGAQFVTTAALVDTVYGGAANYGYLLKNTLGTSLFEVQGSDGKAYFSGSVGIGTNAPARPLHVKTAGSYVARLESTSANSYLEMMDTTANAANASTFGNFNGDLYFQKAGATYGIDFLTGATSKMKILNNGNVGIGTSTPGSKLDVNGNTNITGNLVVTGSLTSGGGQPVCLQNGTNCPATVNGTGTINYMSKFTAANILGNSIVYEDGTNVGISNISPVYKLDATGTTFGVRGTTTAVGGVAIQGTSSGSNAVGVRGDSPNGASAYGVYGTGTTGVGANGTTYGMYASSANTGVFAVGNLYGVYGTATTNGVFGVGNTNGIYGAGAGVANSTGGYFTNLNAGFGQSASLAAQVSGVNYAGYFIGNTLTTGTATVTGALNANGGVASTGNLSLSSGGTTVMTMDSSGNVGIGSGTGVYRLIVQAGVNGLYAAGSTYAGYFAGPLNATGNITQNGILVCLANGTNCPAGGGVTGAGTLNTLTKYTATGSTVGNSQITDDGTYIGVGGTSGTSKFNIQTAVQQNALSVSNTFVADAVTVKYGVSGSVATTEPNSAGIYGTGPRVGVSGQSSASVNSKGVSGYSSSGVGVYGSSVNAGGYGVYGDGGGSAVGVYGYANNVASYGVQGYNNTGGSAVYGQNPSSGYGVYGYSGTGSGVYGYAVGSGSTGSGVQAYNVASGYRAYLATYQGGIPYAGYFTGTGLFTGSIGVGGYGPTANWGITSGGSAYGGVFYGGATGVYTSGTTYGLQAYGGPYGVYASGSTYSFYGAGGALYNAGDIDAPNNVWGTASAWIYCTTGSGSWSYCTCPTGSFVGQVAFATTQAAVACYKP